MITPAPSPKLFASLALVALGLLVGPAHAARPTHAWTADAGIQFAEGGRSPTVRNAQWGRGSSPRTRQQLDRLRRDLGPLWTAWNPTTNTVSRIVTSGLPAPEAIDSPARAEAHARRFLADHLDVLAPGSAPGDFELVSNHLSAGIRTVAFRQLHDGIEVLGGQISLRFKADRLAMIASEAWPHVRLPRRASAIEPARARARAEAWIAADVQPERSTTTVNADDRVILPMVHEGSARIEYREVTRALTRTEGPASHFVVYVDTATGEPLARESLLRYADAIVQFQVPDRSPVAGYVASPAVGLELFNAGASLVTDATGTVTLASAPTTIELGVAGPQVLVANQSGEPAAIALPIASDGATAVWGAPDDEFVDAQLTSFIHASLVKGYVRRFAPDLTWTDEPLTVNVNIGDECNAFYDQFESTINFFVGSEACENTGRLPDVVYHEYGHSVHDKSIIAGAGIFNGALSEGVSDYLSATMTDDSGIGRGFFYDDSPLRELDPVGSEWTWPEDRGEVHDEGRIIGGALWDLRTLLVAKLGAEAGRSQADEIYYEATRRAVDIPSMYTEALLVDDDDGNLANGTPNGCEINQAFGAHGLYNPGDGAEVVELTAAASGHRVRLSLSTPSFPACPVSASPTLSWRIRGTAEATSVPMSARDGVYVADIPTQTGGTVVEYQVKVNYSNGTEGSLPDNIVDPWYQTFFGDVTPLHCFGSSETPWTFSGGTWSFGPLTESSSIDPPTAYDDDGIALFQAGSYLPNDSARATSIAIDTAGHTDVRLHLYRWLTVEDGFFDRAIVYADDEPIWRNFASEKQAFATFAHLDAEWRFQDLDLSPFVDDEQVTIAFELSSDGGLEFGGWSIDGLCVVAVADDLSSCGNGVVDSGEECDDGNIDEGDGCDRTCRFEDLGESESDSDGTDPGDTETGGLPGADGDTGLIGRGCACSAGGEDSSPLGVAALSLALLGLATRRRRAPAGRGSVARVRQRFTTSVLENGWGGFSDRPPETPGEQVSETV